MKRMSKAIEKLLEGVKDPNELWRRDHIAFTLALIFRDMKLDKDESLNALKWWNGRNARPFREKSLRRMLDYIYSKAGKREQASWHWVELLSGERVEDELRPQFSDLRPGELKKAKFESKRRDSHGS